eukprot:TRINITY_DN9574_c1_g1_i3.p1 TRINITY_DN9574_c1_g1~~TRINITY_DN9574_c1_g1_i3.p1  ORF type:complete len:384 (-),score=38.43 TRINITY_DN9574_c1_g1_i3:337-1404(-)
MSNASQNLQKNLSSPVLVRSEPWPAMSNASQELLKNLSSPVLVRSESWPAISNAEESPTKCSQLIDTFLRKHFRSSLSNEYVLELQDQISRSSLHGRVPMLLVSTRRVVCIVDNFLVHASIAAPGAEILLVSLDVESHEFCSERVPQMKNVTLHCLNVSSWLPTSFHRSDKNTSFVVNAGTDCIGRLALWAKPLLLLHAGEQARNGVFLVDADVVLLGNLPEWCASHVASNALLMGADEWDYLRGTPVKTVTSKMIRAVRPKSSILNTGTMFATQRSVPLINSWLEEAGKGSHDQEGLHRAILRLNTSIQFIGRKIVGLGCVKRGSMALHCTYMRNKRESLRRQGLWQPSLARCK